jgi:hypothetical protein
MHVGEPLDVFQDPEVMAEYVAGQFIGRNGDQITSARQAFAQIQEHSEAEAEITDNTSAFLIPTKSLTPTFKDWIVMRSMVNLGHHFLATDLDTPQSASA